MAAHETSTVEPGAPPPRPVPFHPWSQDQCTSCLPGLLEESSRRALLLLLPEMSGFPGPFFGFLPALHSLLGAVSRFSVLLVRVSLLKPRV